MRRALVAIFTGALFLAGASTALAQWPTTCVELNDLAEAAAGRHHNVGIYQRSVSPPSLQAAEAACQHDHRTDVQRSFAWALGSQGGEVSGIWPTTCVELNDLAEAARGDPSNVGIYQRIFVHDFEAERACRSDHRVDVQQTFSWATPAQSPAPAPAPPAAPDPSTNADYPRVRDVAIARGASFDVASTVAADVIGRGTVSSFLYGTDDGVLYGRYRCHWQSSACPLAPVYVPPPEPQIEASLQPIWDLVHSIDLAMFDDPALHTVRVKWGWTRAGVVATYTPATHTITMGTAYRNERPEALAPILAHELAHAASGIPHNFGYDDCLRFELWAFLAQGLVWLESGKSPISNLEWNHEAVAWVILSAPLGNTDNDLSDWIHLLDYIGSDLGYYQSCAA